VISTPRLYAIVDAAFFLKTEDLAAFAEELAAGGCTLLQYRNKSGHARVMLEQARELSTAVAGEDARATLTYAHHERPRGSVPDCGV
jgi:thiamine monophosphate synthase